MFSLQNNQQINFGAYSWESVYKVNLDDNLNTFKKNLQNTLMLT